VKIDPSKCAGCGVCAKYCPGNAVTLEEVEKNGKKRTQRATVNEDLCFECGVCVRVTACPRGAFVPAGELPWPRSIRAILSDPLVAFKETGVTGRGTEEMKTNDVTGRFRRGEIGVAIDVGRPNVGARLSDVERLTALLAPLGVTFEPANPVTYLMDDPATGRMNPEVRDERVLSAVIEFTILERRLPEALTAIDAAAAGCATVFAVGLITRPERDGQVRLLETLRRLGRRPLPNAKVNAGLGRPAAPDR
jgi:NAD-dependent dihydropyrimidine dehydrogenase PreA subunit